MINWWLRYCAVIFMIFGEWASDWGGPVTGETRYREVVISPISAVA